MRNSVYLKKIKYIFFILPMLCVFLISLDTISCKKENNDVTGPGTDTIPQPEGWKLVWHDEFDGPKLDATKWSYEVNGDGGGNNELQYYTDNAKNLYIENGCLVIKAIKEDYQGKKYTSARIRTYKKGDWTYGRFVVKAKLPYGKGMWPAAWMLPTDREYGGWPQSGEIDIMENLGQESWKIYGTIHFGPPWPNNQKSGGNYSLMKGTFANDFHVFTIDWDSTGMQWYVDDIPYHKEVKGKPFDKRFHFLLNVAVGGNWPGSPDEFTVFPQTMIVDYVRIFERKK